MVSSTNFKEHLSYSGGIFYGDEGNRYWIDGLNKARAAIRKAKGEQS